MTDRPKPPVHRLRALRPPSDDRRLGQADVGFDIGHLVIALSNESCQQANVRLAADPRSANAVATRTPLYAPCVKRVRALIERLRGGRRPPTGPLTTAEKATADELGTQNSLKGSERSKHEHEHEHEHEERR
jgi:hypothetical protein